MRPELQRLHDQLTAARADLAAVGDTARTATNGWTVAQVLEHLAKVNELCAASVGKSLDAAPPRTDDDPVRYSWLERMTIKAMAGRSFRLPVPPGFEPGAAGPEARDACLRATDDLLRTIERADEKRLAGLRTASPELPWLKLGTLAYLDALVQHARYHRGQI